MNVVKGIALSIVFGMLAVATLVAGTIIGVVVSIITPLIVVFTGLWAVWFINQDYDDEDPKD